MDFINYLVTAFEKTFIRESRYVMFLDGLGKTLLITIGATLLGVLIGALIAVVKTIYKQSGKLKILNALCEVYTTVIRGTPVVVQLLIMYFIVFVNSTNSELVGILAFGINSGAYVAENIRGGILSVDIGQTEAGRALGLSSGTTMFRIVIPQAIKNVIPSIGNEMIALIKETSIVSMIGMYDLTAAAKDVGSGQNLASYIAPMTVVALFYLAIVYALTFCVKQIERRLRSGDKR